MNSRSCSTRVFRRACAHRATRRLFLVAGMLGSAAISAHAATSITWSGGTSTDFEINGNWVGGTKPASSIVTNIALFEGAVTANQPTITVARSINGLLFTTATGGWVLSDPGAFSLTVGDGGVSTAGQTSGTNTIDARLIVGADQIWQAGTGGTLVFNGSLIGGAGSNVTIGSSGNAGTVTLNPFTVSYLGAGKTLTLAFGTLNINKAGALGAASTAFVINGGTTIDNTSGASITTTASYAHTWNGDFTVGGTNALNLGTTATVSLGTAAGATREITVNGTGTTGLLTVGGVISEGPTAKGLIKSGTGTLTLNGDNTYTTTTTINDGTLILAGTNSYSGTVINGGTLSARNTGALGNSAGAVTIANGGTLDLRASFSTGTTAHNLSVSGTTTVSVVGGLNWGLATTTLTGSGTLNYSITAGNSIQWQGANSMTSGSIAFGSSGGIFIFQGTSNVGNAAVAFDTGSGSVTLRNSTNSATDKTVHLGSLTGGSGTILEGGTLGATAGVDDTWSIGALGTNTTFAGTIRNGIGTPNPHITHLTKVGAGSLTLTGANTYTGATIINGGSLLVHGSISGSTVTVNTGGTLGGGLGATAGTVGAVTVNSGGTLSPGASAGILNTGDLNLANGSAFKLELNGNTVGTDYDQAGVTGSVTLGGGNIQLTLGAGFAPIVGQTFTILANDGTLDLILGTFATVNGSAFGAGNTFTLTNNTGTYDFQLFYGGEGAATFGGNDLVLQVVPEPNAAVMLLGGVGLLGFWRRHRRQS